MSQRKFGICSLVIVLSFVICHLSFPVEAMGGPAPKKQEAAPVALADKVFLIDNFESGSIKTPREWWTFNIETADVVSNKDYMLGERLDVGNYSFLLSGMAKNWYAGGCGTYLAKEGEDLSKYNALVLDIYGNGPGSGTVKIELLDDDNSNWQVEQDPAKNFAPIYDDRFVYEVRVDWGGWKREIIPLADFVDDNPGVGDDIWNPQQLSNSGGLLSMQLICLATSDKGKVNLNLDNISLLLSEK